MYNRTVTNVETLCGPCIDAIAGFRLKIHLGNIDKQCSADPVQTSRNEASDQGQHCLLIRISEKYND